MNKNTEKNKVKAPKVFITRNAADPMISPGRIKTDKGDFWRWGDDNLFPSALALMSRRSTIHRRIINDKADYISGKGFSFDQQQIDLGDFVCEANGDGESLRHILNKVALDKMLFGNAFLEVVTDKEKSFLSLYHQDASKCRLARDSKHVILHHNWRQFTPSEAKTLSLYPQFKTAEDGTMRAMIHYKDYEPMFQHYGLPTYVAGLNVSSIAYKTDKWNISRLDNSFQLSGVMLLDGGVDSEQEAAEIVKAAEGKFGGTPGQVMFMIKDNVNQDNSKFIPITSSNDGDWKHLHDQATTDIVIAHSWFRALSGLDYSVGFSSQRILHEYDIALNTVILGEQEELMEPIRAVIENILKIDTASLRIINLPPSKAKPAYMKVWEARKADGLDYDHLDHSQQMYISQISRETIANQ